MELQRRQVDGYPMVEQAQVQQLSGIPAGLGNDPVTQVHDLPGFLGNGDEPGRRDEPLDRVAPAYQSLQPAEPAVLVHLGLIIEEQLVIAQRLLQLVAQGYPGGQLLVQIAGKDHIGIATLLLGLVHRHVRLLQHPRRRIQILGQEADADTGGDIQLVAADPVRLADLVENAISNQLGLPFGFQVGQQQDEFIAAETRQGIGGADRAVEAPGHIDQNLITDTVPEGIVDGLETIQVDEHDCQLLAAAPGQLDIVFQAVLQQGAVGQAGERVVGGLVGQLAFVLLLLRHVLHDDGVVGNAAVLVLDRRQGQLVPEGHAVASQVAHGEGRGFAVGDGGADQLDIPRLLHRAGNHRQGAGARFLPAAPRHAGEGGIDEHHRHRRVPYIHHQHGVIAGFQTAGQQSLVLLGLQAFGNILDHRVQPDHGVVDQHRHEGTFVITPVAGDIQELHAEGLRTALDGPLEGGIEHLEILAAHGLAVDHVLVAELAQVLVIDAGDELGPVIERDIAPFTGELEDRVG